MENVNTLVLRSGVIADNYKRIVSACGGDVVCVLKADAYGHGAADVACVLYKAGARSFAVANMDEALGVKMALRGGFATVCVLGYVPVKDLAVAKKHGVVVPVVSAEYFEEFLKSDKRPACYIQIDTGMHRLGIDWRDQIAVKEIFARAKAEGVQVMGVASHLYASDESTFTLQKTRFLNAAGGFGSVKSLCASGALCDFVTAGEVKRAGLCLYGYGKTAEKLGNVPALSLYSRVVLIRLVKKGESVGYDAVYKAERDLLVGVVPIGYADGIMRAYRGASVFVQGKECEILAVCMDMIMIKLPFSARLYDEVTVFSTEKNLEKMTERAGTIVYEGLTAIGKRYKRTVK